MTSLKLATMQKWCKLLKDKEKAQRVHKSLLTIVTLCASRVTVTPAEMKTIRPEAYIGGKILSLIFPRTLNSSNPSLWMVTEA
jgi:hypothetical protein